MKKVGIVSCDKWKGKIEEDQNLRDGSRSRYHFLAKTNYGG